ncbi:MAG TPA: hypothetical protein VHO72_11445 [Bacteroidales bacterium]|nr:hypothetical protein [Bacteroidales bacterium]
MIATATMAANLESTYFVKNTGELTNCKQILFRANDIKVVYENGTAVFIPKNEVKAILLNNMYYEKLPVYKNNEKTGKEEFMQFVATRGGLKLFKYTGSLAHANGSKGFNVNGFTMDYYVVYKGDELWVEVTDVNYPTLFTFFGVKYNEA